MISLRLFLRRAHRLRSLSPTAPRLAPVTRAALWILLSGISPQLLGSFLDGELRQIPGVKRAHNYVLDGAGAVLASTNPARPIGYRFSQSAQVTTRGKYWYCS